MEDISQKTKERIRRSITHELVRMEDDFDKTRQGRAVITDKLLNTVNTINLVDEKGELVDDVEDKLKVVTATLKALSDTERASATAISLKLKNQEQEVATAAAAKDRLAVVIQATKPGVITQVHASVNLEDKLEEMFSHEVKDFELKMNPRDLEEDGK